MVGIVASYVDRRVSAELKNRGVVVWYDPARAWLPWIESLGSGSSSTGRATACKATIGGSDVNLVIGEGSHYEILQACEPLVSGLDIPCLLVYVSGEPYLEMHSPLRELECLGGEKEPYQRDLAQVARQAFISAGLAESKVDDILGHDSLDFDYLDSITVGADGASPLAPIFGSSREVDVLPSFIVDAALRKDAGEKGLLPEVAALASSGLGLEVSPESDADSMKAKFVRALLVAEMRGDLDGPEPVSISQIKSSQSDEHVQRVRNVCQKLRREHADEYEGMADQVEAEFGLASALIAPEALGRIDTFRFEEKALHAACDQWLSEGENQRVLEVVEGRLREKSFWVSVGRYPARHAAWEACRELAGLAQTIDRVAAALKKVPSTPKEWVEAYTEEDGWFRMDQQYRSAEYRLTRLEDGSTLEHASEKVFSRYEDTLEHMATEFTKVFGAANWQIDGALLQEEIYDRCVHGPSDPVAYIFADAMRYEMGDELKRLIEAIGGNSARLEPAIAAMPTITDLGMVALLPGARKSFSMAGTPKGVTGTIAGKPLIGSPSRMDHAKAEIPGLVEATLDHFVHTLTSKQRDELVKDAPIIIIRSQEIDGTGENLPSGIARKIMGTILEDIRTAVQNLAKAGVTRFVVTADHGHLFGKRRGDDMKMDPPSGGQTVDLHRRCWVGRGGDTPAGCVRLTAADMGYEGTDLDLVVPKGLGVFKAGGSLAFHHGGVSLQELVIPVLTFEMEAVSAAKPSKIDMVGLEGIPKEINNRIFSVRITATQPDMLEPLRVRVFAESTADHSIVGQATFATSNWNDDENTLVLSSPEPIDVGIQLDDDEVRELRIVVVEVDTNRTLKDTQPIAVRVIS